MISASSFDKMCADMAAQRDDMAEDYYAHGSREVVSDELATNNQVNRHLVGNFVYQRSSVDVIGNLLFVFNCSLYLTLSQLPVGTYLVHN